jgi:hypothetical protein
MRFINSKEYWDKVIKICNKSGHKFRTNSFGICWCTRCGQLGPWSNATEMVDDDKLLILNENDCRLKLGNAKVIAVDFDGTVVKSDWPRVGENIPGAFEVLRELIRNGHKIILHTQREHETVEEIEDVLQIALDKLKEEGISLYSINEFPARDNKYYPSRKTYADIYIDDHNAMIPLVSWKNNKGVNLPYVDWIALDSWFVDNGFYKKRILG